MKCTILYEYQCGTTPKAFGPHALLLACVCDVVNAERMPKGEALLSRWDLQRAVIAHPKNGDGNLKRALSQEVPTLLRNGPVIVVFDHDKVRRCFLLPGDACKMQIIHNIHTHNSTATVVLLEQNIEDLLAACCAATGRQPPSQKPNPNERDMICQHIAADTTPQTLRDQMRALMPSFDRLVRQVSQWIQTQHNKNT